jgi:DNA-binding SARP family transcriptional activator
VRLDVLDGLCVHAGGCEVELPPSAARVLAYLAVAERPVHRVTVASMLWLDCEEGRALASLRTALWRLGSVASGLVEASATRLRLAPDAVVDLREMRAAIERIRAAEIPERADIDRLDHSGDLLADHYDDWIVMRREQLRQERLLALELACTRLTRAARYEDAAAAGLAAVVAEPLRESSHRVLVALHLRAGNPGEALRQYDLFVALLHRALDLEPSDAIRALVRHVGR